MEGKGNPSIKELKSFDEEEYSFSNDDLHFDSRFENGNLHCAFRRRNCHEYHLFMSNDTNTLGYNQWFYFSLRNMRAQTKYSFKVANYVLCCSPRERAWSSGSRGSKSPCSPTKTPPLQQPAGNGQAAG